MLQITINQDTATPYFNGLKSRLDDLSNVDRGKVVDKEQLDIIEKNYKERIFVRGLNTSLKLLPFYRYNPNPDSGQHLVDTGYLKSHIKFYWTKRRVNVKLGDNPKKIASLEERGGTIFSFTTVEAAEIVNNANRGINRILNDQFSELFKFSDINYKTDWTITQNGRQKQWKRL